MVRAVTDARGALCLQCRTALAPGEACDVSANHRVVMLGEPSERARALDTVWGPPHLRAGKAAAVGGSGGAAGGLFEGCGACGDLGGGGEIGGIVVMIVIVAIAAIAIWWIATRIAHAIRAHRARLRPLGALALPEPRARVEGAVTRGEAWGIELTHGDAIGGTKVTLRDGGTPGLQITLDDGQVIEVPAGRVRLDGDGAKIDGLATARRVDPEYREHDDHPVIAWERAEEVRLAVGDRVALLGALDRRPDPSVPAGGYRDAAPSILVPAGIPRLRRV